MPHRLIEAVPNFSEGRDRGVVKAIVAAVEAGGAEVLDWSADPDHHRSVVTLVGTPAAVERSVLAAARVAVERIDLRRHHGVHPRVGALDVLPFVPLAGVSREGVRRFARRVGARLARDVGLPVLFYGDASSPPGRRLADLRRGGFEALASGWPADRQPDLLPDGWRHPGAHPSAGVACVGARRVLLAWNVVVDGADLDAVRALAADLRESGGGFRGVRALGLRLGSAGRVQLSMNLEDPDAVSPMDVFRAIEARLATLGARVVHTEVIGMLPDQLLLAAAADRLGLLDPSPDRVLSRRVASHLAGKGGAEGSLYG